MGEQDKIKTYRRAIFWTTLAIALVYLLGAAWQAYHYYSVKTVPALMAELGVTAERYAEMRTEMVQVSLMRLGRRTAGIVVFSTLVWTGLPGMMWNYIGGKWLATQGEFVKAAAFTVSWLPVRCALSYLAVPFAFRSCDTLRDFKGLAIAFFAQALIFYWVCKKLKPGRSFAVLFSLLLGLLYVGLSNLPVSKGLQPMPTVGEPWGKIAELANRVGFPISKIWVKDDLDNAYYTATYAGEMIVIGRKLQEKTSNEGMAAIMGHELGHRHHRHLVSRYALFLLYPVLAVMIGTLGVLGNPFCFSVFGFETEPLAGVLPIAELLAGIGNSLTSPVELYQSRVHEYEADAYSGSLGYGKDLARALVNLHPRNNYSASPGAYLFWSHPSTMDRAAAVLHRERQ